MLVKYAVDAAAVWLATRQVWSPLDYLLPSMTLREPKLRLFPAWLIVAMLLWSLPFLWIGACMTVRRALDAGRSPWLVILFFVPLGAVYLIIGMPVFAVVLRLYERAVPDLDASTVWPLTFLALAPFAVFPLHDIEARCFL